MKVADVLFGIISSCEAEDGEIAGKMKILAEEMQKNLQILEAEEIVINPFEHVVCYKEQEIKFTNREFWILYLLVEYRGLVLSKQQIYSQVTGDQERVDYHTVEITVSRIRKKLERMTGRHDLITAIRGRGYKFKKKI